MQLNHGLCLAASNMDLTSFPQACHIDLCSLGTGRVKMFACSRLDFNIPCQRVQKVVSRHLKQVTLNTLQIPQFRFFRLLTNLQLLRIHPNACGYRPNLTWIENDKRHVTSPSYFTWTFYEHCFNPLSEEKCFVKNEKENKMGKYILNMHTGF